jgi:hypothetical protein
MEIRMIYDKNRVINAAVRKINQGAIGPDKTVQARMRSLWREAGWKDEYMLYD